MVSSPTSRLNVAARNEITTLHLSEHINSDSDQEVFYADTISAVDLDDSQLVTLKLESGNYLRFQPDTGAQCNVIPVSLYRKATKDYDLERVTPAKAQLAA